MRYGLTLSRGVSVVRDPKLRVTMQRAAVAVAVAAAVATVPPVIVPLPAGTDRWYDALTNARIPWRAIDAETAPDTPNFSGGGGGGAFSWDDDGDFENEIVDGYFGGGTPDGRSAWWSLRVPADAPDGCTLTVDNFQSVLGPDNPSPSNPFYDPQYYPDLYLNLFTTDVDPIPSAALPNAELDFRLMYQVAYDEDTADAITGKQYCSRIANFPLVAGKTYWIRTDLYTVNSDAQDDVIYRLRFTLSIPA